MLLSVEKKLDTQLIIEETKKASVYKMDPKEWIGWSEEPPYFDDDDIEDDTVLEFDKANVAKTKFNYGGERGVDAQTTDLWTKRNILLDDPPATPVAIPITTTTAIPAAVATVSTEEKSSVNFGTVNEKLPLVDSQSSLLLLIEMNRKFESVERRLDTLAATICSSSLASSNNSLPSPTNSVALYVLVFIVGYALGLAANN